MDTHTGVAHHNWFGDVRSFPAVVVRPTTTEELIAIVRDTARYPSPVRAAGSSHSTTACVVADAGTLVDMRGMARILHIGEDTVTTQAGALYIDVAEELRKRNLQFYVNMELGNLTLGSAACTQTKDASFAGEYGIVGSYAIGMKVVLSSGEVLAITQDQPELLRAMRTSFGLLGIVFEATFRVKPLKPLAVHHESFQLDDLERQLHALKARGESMMYYLFPFQNRISVEFRRYVEHGKPVGRSMWQVRNLAWKTIVPALGGLVRNYVPTRGARDLLLGGIGHTARGVLTALRAGDSYPSDQMIRYPEKPGLTRYTFSIWAFPEDSFLRVVRAYYAFCREHYRARGYRCDLPNVGYRVNHDTSSLFSYAYQGTVMTVDPVSTGGPGWPEFLDAYNEFCSANGGAPLFNQTARLTPGQIERAYGDRLDSFRSVQRRSDPTRRFVNRYFADLLGLSAGAEAPVGVT